jgi:hypothetical protein
VSETAIDKKLTDREKHIALLMVETNIKLATIDAAPTPELKAELLRLYMMEAEFCGYRLGARESKSPSFFGER